MRSSVWGRGVLVFLVALGLAGFTRAATSSGNGAVAARWPGVDQRVARRALLAGEAVAPARAVGAFGFDLMRRLGGGNLVFSPDSVAGALAMAGMGAAGRTAEQMASVLQLASPGAFADVGQLQSAVAAEQMVAGHGNPQAPTLDIANGLFVQQGYPLRPSFLSGLQESFGAVPQTVDFQNASTTGAVQAINGWVNEHTRGVIPQILSSLPSQTRLALANAIYLRAAWAHPFEAHATVSAPFHGQREVTVVPFMHETEWLPYGHGQGYAAVELPYLASTLSLLVVLPVGQSVASLQHRLNAGGLAQIVHRLVSEPVALSLPRFHLAFQAELNRPLEALGMTEAFSEAADFSRIATGEQLKLGLVEHAADFSVDEQGTLAAAATVVTIEPTVARGPIRPKARFDASRPFLFFLRDDRTGTVLFVGRLAEPAARPAP
ncbi:MAG: serpin family protein [Solirubrobacteraceae bacterium]